MKYFFALLIVLSVVSCKKDPEPADQGSTNSLIGSWKWLSTSDSDSSVVIEQTSPTHYQQINITDILHYNWYENDTLQHQGTYTLKLQQTFLTGTTRYVLKLQNLPATPFIVDQQSDSLILQEDVANGRTFVFQKL